jgi:hypothetical protein
VEEFCAAAQPSDSSSSRSKGEPRREQARLLHPIADRQRQTIPLETLAPKTGRERERGGGRRSKRSNARPAAALDF